MRVCLFGDAQSVHLQQLVPGLAAQGLAVHVVTHKPAEIAGATIERFAVPPPSLTNARRWRNRRREYLRGFLRRFDVINIHFLSDWGFCSDDGAGLRADELEDACVAASPWGSDIVDPPGETPASCALTKTRVALLQAAAIITTCGPSFADTVAEFAAIPRQSVRVLPFGVDIDLVHPLGTRSPSQPPVVGFFKGFREVYGPTCLIRAIPYVLAAIPRARFELIGDGPALPQCQSLARELGIDACVTWIPRQTHGNLAQFLSHWVVSVIPSVHEAFGVAALESAAMRVPVVASDVCGLRDTVQNGVTGILVPPSDPPALAAALISLLSDETRMAEMGAAGRDMVERYFRWSQLIPRWVAAYHEARDRCSIMV